MVRVTIAANFVLGTSVLLAFPVYVIKTTTVTTTKKKWLK